jgi:hypothetical protein
MAAPQPLPDTRCTFHRGKMECRRHTSIGPTRMHATIRRPYLRPRDQVTHVMGPLLIDVPRARETSYKRDRVTCATVPLAGGRSTLRLKAVVVCVLAALTAEFCQRSTRPTSAFDPGCAKTRTDLVVMPRGARISAFFCSPCDHSPQNSGCICTAQTFHTAWNQWLHSMHWLDFRPTASD